MKKLLALVVVMLVACAPLSFAAACPNPDSYDDNYGKAAGAKVVRGLSNAALGWVEILRQPVINENKWEGVSKGFVYAVGRTGSGALEAATFFIPQADIPLLTPACPLEF